MARGDHVIAAKKRAAASRRILNEFHAPHFDFTTKITPQRINTRTADSAYNPTGTPKTCVTEVSGIMSSIFPSNATKAQGEIIYT